MRTTSRRPTWPCSSARQLRAGRSSRASLQRDIGVILTRVHNTRVDENVFSACSWMRCDATAWHSRRHCCWSSERSLRWRARCAARSRLRHGGRALEIAPESRGPVLAAQRHVRPPDVVGDSPSSSCVACRAGSRASRAPWRTAPSRCGCAPSRARTNADGWTGSSGGSRRRSSASHWSSPGSCSAIDDGGPMLTGNVPAFAFLGSVVGLGGLLLLLRSLRDSAPASHAVRG